MKHDHPTPPALSREETALAIIRTEGFVNSSHAAGSVLASEGTAWRYIDDGLTEVPWSEYERALGDDPAGWDARVRFRDPHMEEARISRMLRNKLYSGERIDHARVAGLGRKAGRDLRRPMGKL